MRESKSFERISRYPQSHDTVHARQPSRKLTLRPVVPEALKIVPEINHVASAYTKYQG